MGVEWDIIEVGKLADSISDTHSFSKGQLIFLNTSDIFEGKILHQNYSCVKDLPGQAKKSIKKGDILFSEIRPANGRYALVNVDADDYVVSTKLMVIRSKKGVSTKYLYHFLTSKQTTAWLQHLAESRSGTFPQITFDQVSSLELKLPPSNIQSSIVEILDSLDDKIELNSKMNETLEETVRTIFKSWFVDFDPVVAKSEGRKPEGVDAEIAKLFPDSFVDSEIGRIPKGWKVSSLRSICKNIYSGGTPRTENPAYWGGDIPWLSSGETRNRFIVATEKFITEEGVANSSTRLAHNGCSVIASAGQGHTRGQTSLLTFDCYVNQSVVVLAADKKVVSDCYLFFNLERRYEQFRQLSDSHSSRGSLTTKLLADLQTVVPPKHLVDCFESLVAPIVLKISDNIHQSINLSIIRDSLLPRLLSGEVRTIDNKQTGGKHAVAM